MVSWPGLNNLSTNHVIYEKAILAIGIPFSEGILKKVDTLIPNGNTGTLKVSSGHFLFSPTNLQGVSRKHLLLFKFKIFILTKS